jgi:hypothetical protein
MTEIEVDVVGSDVQLRLSDEIANALFHLNTHDVTNLLLQLFQAIRSIPSDPTAPLGRESPILVAWPSFQVGVTPEGELAVMVRPDPLPPMEFRFTDEGARDLINGLSKGLTMPRQSRPAKPHH